MTASPPGSIPASTACTDVPAGSDGSRATPTLAGEVSPLAWTILEAQSGRCGVEAAALDRDGLGRVAPLLVRAISRFSSPDKAALVQRRLDALLA